MKLKHKNGSGPRRSALARALTSRAAVLGDTSGSTAEAIVSTVLSIFIIGIIASGTVSATGALGVESSNAERTQQLNIMAEKPSTVSGWAAAQTSALDQKVTLPSGAQMSAYLWSVPSAVGAEYFASMARSGNTDHAAVCNDIATVHADSCVYASAFHAKDLRAILPPQAPGLVVSDLTSVIQPRTNIATMPAPAAAAEYRFYIDAASIGSPDEIQFIQDGNYLGIVPVQTVADSYFGTILVSPGGPVTVMSPGRAMDVSRVMIYKAGP